MANTHSLDLESSSSQYAYISDANQTGLDITGDISIEAWVKIESDTTTTSQAIVTKYNTSNNRSYLFGYKNSTGESESGLFFYTSANGSDATVKNVEITLTAGIWYHVAMVYNASVGSVTFYVNGSQTGTTQTGLDTSLYNSIADFNIGAFQGNSYFFDGLIDEVRVWNDIRTATEIADNYQKELTGTEANLVGYWKFNNDYTDETSNNNDLTAVNNPVFSTDVPFVGGGTTDDTNFFGINF